MVADARGNASVRWGGAVILFVVAYIHLALFSSIMSFRLLPVLFLINGLGSLIAAVGVLANSRWFGWILGLVMAGGAAVAKIAMNTIPGVGAFLLGLPAGGNIPRIPNGIRKFRGGHFIQFGGGHTPHSILPLFMNIGTLAIVAIFVELLFVVLATYAHFTMRPKRQAPEDSFSSTE